MKKATLYPLVATLLLLWLAAAQVWAAAKVKIAIPARTAPHYALPMLADEERGFSRKEGLDSEWFAFGGGGQEVRSLAAGATDVAVTSYTSAIVMAARGIPAMLVGDLKFQQPWYVWVLTESPLRAPGQLAGTRIAISRTGSMTHIYAMLAARALGLEGNVKFVAAGGVSEAMAALKAGVLDALVLSFMPMGNLIFSGQVRGLVNITEYLPQGQSDVNLVVKRTFPKSQPQNMKKINKAISEAAQFTISNREWSLDKLIKVLRYTPAAAEGVLKALTFSRDLTVNEQAVKDTREFLIAYNLIKREEAPRVEEVFSNEYLP